MKRNDGRRQRRRERLEARKRDRERYGRGWTFNLEPKEKMHTRETAQERPTQVQR